MPFLQQSNTNLYSIPGGLYTLQDFRYFINQFALGLWQNKKVQRKTGIE